MLGWKTIFAFFSAIIYTILIILYIYFEFNNYDNFDDGECTADKPCIRFCGTNQSRNDELFEKFNSYYYFYENRLLRLNFYNGEPKCIDKIIENPLAKRYEVVRLWNFSH